MSISSIEIPLTYYNISSYNNNNIFSIQELSGTEVSGNIYNIRLTSGLYEARFNATNLNTNVINTNIIAYNIVDEINNALLQNTDFDISDNIRCSLDSRTGKTYFEVIDNPNKSYKINFDIDNSNNTNIKYNCHENYLYQKLGWQLGFITPSITIDSNGRYSDRVCAMNYPRYIYIAIDDFQPSSRNYFSVAAPSLIAPNIIARINMLSLLEEKTAFKQAANAGDYLFTQKHIREYFGPTDINKLRIQLLDEYGRPLNLNGSDWSFVVTFECFYN
jgi:hypothetical protein